jgi:alkylation response protein AidB-like acyl-CoA dehydrogenase
MSKPGGLLEALTFMFLSSQAGEAGHNCPVACTAGIVRVFQKVGDFPQKEFYWQKLLAPSFTNNFTGAQFLTEIQGGSDVGRNATVAYLDDQKQWRIRGEKWFCSNANAELILMTARYDEKISGTKGLGLFLVPAVLQSGEHNFYTFRRLKDKIGTRSMASAEIDFHDAIAIPMGLPVDGFKMVMENVLHLSRLFNTFCMLGMVRRAYHIAYSYAQHRIAFDQPIFQYSLVKENLARIKAENTAMLAAIFATTQLQDNFDQGNENTAEMKLLLRLLANLNKYVSALWSVEHIHHALDVLAGNGAIENFSVIPRLLRDSIVCENWEGTHNTLRMQIFKDIVRYQIDIIFIQYLESSLKTLKTHEKYANAIKQCMLRLQEELRVLKSAPAVVQELQIKVVVDLMAVLFCAVQLLKEAVDQQKNEHHSKLYCLDYFIVLHIEARPIKYNQDYVELIGNVVGQ